MRFLFRLLRSLIMMILLVVVGGYFAGRSVGLFDQGFSLKSIDSLKRNFSQEGVDKLTADVEVKTALNLTRSGADAVAREHDGRYVSPHFSARRLAAEINQQRAAVIGMPVVPARHQQQLHTGRVYVIKDETRGRVLVLRARSRSGSVWQLKVRKGRAELAPYQAR